MNIQLGNRTQRGVIGIEAAIVMIAFVIVAAALSFVVLNMGLSTTQQAKETVSVGLGEASSALHVSGSVISAADVPRSKVNATAFPIKVVSGGSAVNLNATLAKVKFNTGTVQYDNILAKQCVLTTTTYTNLQTALSAAVTSGCITASPIGSPGNAPTNTRAVIYWSVQKNTNEIIEPGEHAHMVLVFNNADRPNVATPIEAELILSAGPSVDFVRTVPPLVDKYVDMG